MTINLLPLKEKKRIQRIYRSRRIKVTSWLILVLAIVSIAMLIPLYLLSESTQILAEDKRSNLKEETNLDIESIREEIFLINKKAEVLADNEYTRVYKLFSDITEDKRAGVSITGMAFNIKEESKEIDIVGNALDRETLLSFRRDLEQKDYIQKVELPVSNFAQNVDIDFSIKITLE